MKVGTLTFHHSNYGAILQAYALQKTLAVLGHAGELIDYESPLQTSRSRFIGSSALKNNILRLFEMLKCRQFAERREKIEDFRRRFLKISDIKYRSSADLEKSIHAYDAFVCGSDQIWRPDIDQDRNRCYYLGFLKKHQAVKVSYAPSFGIAALNGSCHSAISAWLEDIPNLSVREETGRNIINKLTGRRAEVVLDPTLLLERDHWDTIKKIPLMSAPYLLVYSTSQRGLFPQLVKYVKKVTNLPLVVLSLTSLNLIPGSDLVVYNAGLPDFVGWFANAACVCTNSFHGTAFSLIYRKPFWSVPHNATNSRMADLLERIGLSDRQVTTASGFPVDPLKIDYTDPAILMEEHKQKSINFLKAALSDSLT